MAQHHAQSLRPHKHMFLDFKQTKNISNISEFATKYFAVKMSFTFESFTIDIPNKISL